MPPVLSVYLDLVRFGAAVLVVLHHAWPVLVPAYPLPWPGHEAVVVFFVLSGLVIAHASRRPGLTLGEYAVHRAARVWSVALPALLLSVLAALLIGSNGQLEGVWGAPAQFGAAASALINAIFAGQLWSMDAQPAFNGPYWSLNYEVWYYALFAAGFFLRGRARIVGIAVLAAIAGPKILLLMPVWMLGVLAYRRRPRLSERSAVLLFGATAALALLLIYMDTSAALRRQLWHLWPEVVRTLNGSNEFLGDWLLGIVVAANFVAAASLGRYGGILLALERPIRAASGCTFSAYLYHEPLLAILVLVAGWKHWSGFALLAVGIVVLARATEHQLPAVRRLLHAALSRLGVMRSARPVRASI